MAFKRCQKAIAKNIRSMRERLDHSQSHVAKKLKIPFRYYQEIEGARVNPTLKTLIKFAQFFKVNLDRLVAGCCVGSKSKLS